jgi:hypothetical protein
MDRREALKTTTLFLGYTLTASTTAAILNGCKADTSTTGYAPKFFSEDEMTLMAEVCESILPKTDTPGAKDALCHRWIDEKVKTFSEAAEQKVIQKGLTKFDEVAKSKYSKSFVALSPNEKEAVLGVLFEESKKHDNKDGKEPHIFTYLRENTISGYFTSEVGAKGGLGNFKPVPGPYQGCVDIKDVGKVWVL